MTHPRNKWIAAQPFEPEELSGTYRVTMLSGPFMTLNRFGDVKIIKDGKGYNLLMGWFRWGTFCVRPGRGKSIVQLGIRVRTFPVRPGRDRVRLVYENGIIVDELRRAGDGNYIGRFLKRGIFRGYFSLRKIKEE